MKKVLLTLAILLLLPLSNAYASKILRVGRGNQLGTGFVLASQHGSERNLSLIITAWHVLDTRGNTYAKLGNRTYPAVAYQIGNEKIEVWKDARGHDLAAFFINTGKDKWRPYSTAPAENGKTYHAYGYGSGSFKATKLQTKYTLLGAVRQGDSGGPIFNSKAQVVGMAIEISAPGQGWAPNPRFTHTNAVEPEHISTFAAAVLKKVKWRCPPGGT